MKSRSVIGGNDANSNHKRLIKGPSGGDQIQICFGEFRQDAVSQNVIMPRFILWLGSSMGQAAYS